MKPLEHSSLQCIYCDDVRNEENGKTTIIGWHNSSTILIPSNETMSLHLCIIGIISVPPKFMKLQFELMQEEHVLQSFKTEINKISDDSNLVVYGRQLRVMFRIKDMQISAPCTLRLRAITDDGQTVNTVYGNGLYFTPSIF